MSSFLLLEGQSLLLTSYAALALVSYWFIWIVHSRTFHPLAKVPGPVWASISRTWLMYLMYRGDYQMVHLALHEK